MSQQMDQYVHCQRLEVSRTRFSRQAIQIRLNEPLSK
jgi:hypothetical protein